MTNFIPVFPLNIVAFPGEQVNLHIFEPRYIQLIGDCIKGNKPFGIPPVHNEKISELGTLMEITEVVKQYENGEMDIRIKGLKVFKMLEHIHEIPDKLYSGAIVTYPHNVLQQPDSKLAKLIMDEVRRMYALLDVEGKVPVPQSDSVVSYLIGHFLGLTLEQEIELLGLFEELQRLEYIRRHLNRMEPVIKELENMKARIKMNGHFRDLTLGDLNL